MFRRCARKCAHSGLAEERMHTYFAEYPNKPSLFKRIRNASTWKKVVYPIATPIVLFTGYVGTCTMVHKLHRPTIDKMYDDNFTEEYVMDEWAQVEPTLREGDVVLLMGTGSMSWKITNTQFVLSMMKPGSIRYSHVAVVVQPAQFEDAPPVAVSRREKAAKRMIPSSESSPKMIRGAMMMEAVDNKDVNCPDWRGAIRHDCVQIVEIGKRAFGFQGPRPCYHRFAVRRLQGFEWTPERKERLRTFIEQHEGQPMDKSPKLMIAFMLPALYHWLKVRKGNEISCSELVAELYKATGVLQQRTQWIHVPAANADKNGAPFEMKEVAYEKTPCLEVAPCHFAEGMERYGLDFAPGVGLGPEIRIVMKQPPMDLLYTQ